MTDKRLIWITTVGISAILFVAAFFMLDKDIDTIVGIFFLMWINNIWGLK